MNPRVLITRKLPDAVQKEIGPDWEVEMNGAPGHYSRDELLTRVRGRDAVLVMGDRIDEEVCAAAAPTCKVFANHGVGYNNIDVEAATKYGIYVTNTPDVVTGPTADLAWALLLATARRVAEGDRLIRAGRWRLSDPFAMLGTEVSGKTLGIVGAGRIGRAVAQRARGFNMDILYTANSPKPDFAAQTGARFAELRQLLQSADFVSVHVPLTPATRQLIGEQELTLMKPTAILINTSRGPAVDEQALVKALRSGGIGGAGLDVFEREPVLEPGLAELDNVVLTPHIGTSTLETRIRMAAVCSRNIQAALAGQVPPNCLNPAARMRQEERPR
ncbi:MAG TPA: D-glycerate dehydrogenase [Selenomonadales bacterium]|nr:D-glycerate dehydrogenase [Selenomonadales bacterium]